MAELCLPPQPLRNPRNLRLPPGACDTHFHVFRSGAPLVSPRSYTPQMETLESWLSLADTFGIARGVLVQPSVYGTDNSVLLDALVRHPDRLRGIVVIPADTSLDELRRLDQIGVRGIRINLRNKSGLSLEAVDAFAPHLDDLDWHLQFQVGPDQIAIVHELAERHRITAVIDHLAFIPLDAPGSALDELDRALASGRVFVKIGAPYRLSDRSDHQFYKNTLSMLTVRYPTRLLWGSDWPHTELFKTMPEDDDLIALSLSTIPEQTHAAIFADNAKTLYFSH